MVSSAINSQTGLRGTLLALLLSAGWILGQEVPQKSGFFEVEVNKDEIYSYSNLKFVGDYTNFESPSGHLALGRTEAGVTVVIILGGGTMTIEAPEAHQEKFKAVFGAYPLKTAFKTIYMRLNPKEYDETLGKLKLSKVSDEGSLAKAKELYDNKFLTSYHAGPKAILPPYKTRVMEFDTADFGQISNEEGYWITLRKLSPYGSVYPKNFINPKQK